MSPTFPTLPDMVEAARTTLSPAVWNWIEGGASGEQSLDANRGQFDRLFFAARDAHRRRVRWISPLTSSA
jgi:hypothetical protein